MFTVGEFKGLIEVFTGYDLVTGEDLGWWRLAGFAGFFGLNEIKLLRHGDDLLGLLRRGDDVANAGSDAARRLPSVSPDIDIDLSICPERRTLRHDPSSTTSRMLCPRINTGLDVHQAASCSYLIFNCESSLLIKEGYPITPVLQRHQSLRHGVD
jgi:hypothetical protein